jgi:hypothetical protein
MSAAVTDAISVATLVVIPVRLAVFDLAAVKETIDFARQSKKPFALVINAVPPRRDNTESPFVTQVREVLAGLNVPVWAGQITHRTIYSLSLEYGEGRAEYDADSPRAAEISSLWNAIEPLREGDPRRLCGRRDASGRGLIRRILALLLFSTLVDPAAAQRATGQAVDLALVLAVDASGSVDQVRFELQKQGYVAAFRHPRVIGAIQSGPTQSIAVIMMQWTGPALQVIAVPWTRISDAASANAFADAAARAPRALFGGGTSISGAIDTGLALLFDNPYQATRRVIDISGDGSNNRGRSVNQARDEAFAAGVGINGLPILALEPTSTATISRTSSAARRVRDRREGLRDVRRGDPEEADRRNRRDRSAGCSGPPRGGEPGYARAAIALLQLIRHLVDAGLGADLVLLAARCAGHPTAPRTSSPTLIGSAPCAATTLESQMSGRFGLSLSRCTRSLEGPAERARGVGLAEAVLHGVRAGIVAADLEQQFTGASDDAHRDPIAVGLAGVDATCAIVIAMAADSAFCSSSCALAGMLSAQTNGTAQRWSMHA